MPSDERPEQTTIECPNRWVLDTATPEGSALQPVATLGTRGGSPHPVDGGIRPVGGWPKPERDSGEDTPLLFNPGEWHLPKYKLWELQKLAIADPNASDALRDQLFDDTQIARAAAARTIARKTGRGFDPAAASQLAERIDVRRRPKGRARVGLLSEPNKKSRQFWDFPIAAQASQTVVAIVLRASAGSRNICFDSVPDAVCTVIAAAVDGAVHGVQLDIKNCYPSLRAEHLANIIGVDRRIVKNNVALPPFNPKWVGPNGFIDSLSSDQRELLYPGYRGLPQGGAASSIASAIMLTALFKPFMEIGLVVIYGDDIVVLTPDAAGADAAYALAKETFAGKPSSFGRLAPKTCKRFDLREGTDFVGGFFRVNAHGITARPSDDRFVRFANTIDERLSAGHSQQEVAQYVHRWASSRPYWSSATRFAAEFVRRFYRHPLAQRPVFATQELVNMVRRDVPELGYMPEQSFWAKRAYFTEYGVWPMPYLYRGTRFWSSLPEEDGDD